MLRNTSMVLMIAIAVAGCQSSSPTKRVELPDAAAKCSTKIQQQQPRSKLEIAVWARSKTDIYGADAIADVTIDSRSTRIDIPYVIVPGETPAGQAWKACMLQSGFDITKTNIKL